MKLAKPLLCADVERRGLRIKQGAPIFSLTVTYDGKRADVYANPNGLRKRDLPAKLVRDLESESVEKVFHNAVFDGSVLAEELGITLRSVSCTQVREIIIQGVSLPPIKKKNRDAATDRLYRAHGVSLEDTFARYGLPVPDKSVREAFIDRPLGIPFSKQELDYMKADVLPLYQLWLAQEYLLNRDGLVEVALLESKYLEKRIRAKVGGIGIDRRIWREIAESNGREYDRRLAALPKEVENWNSEKQVKAYFRRIGIHIPVFTSKHPNVEDLDSMYLKTRNKTLGEFIFAREIAKSVTAYGLSWFEDGYIDDDDRIRPDVYQIKETGRVSYSNPNLQQLPGYGRKDAIHDVVMGILYAGEKKYKPQHRRAFVPAKGCVFDKGDFSGQEIGIMAAISGEKIWLDALLRGDSVHALTASLLYPQEWERGASKDCAFPKKCKCPGHVVPYERAKILNFMLAYGGGATRFEKQTGLDNLTARKTIARYKQVVPTLTRYLEKSGRTAEATGVSYSADPYRRRRFLAGERMVTQGKNNPIQAAGANMLKLAVVSIPDEYYCPLEVHDEIVLEVPRAKAKEALRMLEQVMSKAADYITGIKGLIKVEPVIAMNLMKEAGTKGYDLYGNKTK